jgi:hypothetical protein
MMVKRIPRVDILAEDGDLVSIDHAGNARRIETTSM